MNVGQDRRKLPWYEYLGTESLGGMVAATAADENGGFTATAEVEAGHAYYAWVWSAGPGTASGNLSATARCPVAGT